MTVPTVSWGAAWIEGLVLGHTFDGSVLARGRGLASRGAVADLVIEPASVSAGVNGRSAVERRVRLGFRRFSSAEWEATRQVVARSSRYVVALLDGRLPPALHEEVAAAVRPILPGVLDVSIDCSCGNLAESCVHAAAVCAHVAGLLDDDPLMLVTLRGGDRSQLLDGLAPSERRRAADGPVGSRRSAIPGRPDDPTVTPAAAWRRRPAELPVLELRTTAARPRTGATPPPAELGIDAAGLAGLARDAAQRAALVLGASAGAHTGTSPASRTALHLDAASDAVRLGATGVLQPPEVASIVGCAVDDVAALLAAWKVAGAAGVDVLVRSRRLDDGELAAVAGAWEVAVKSRSTGAVLPDGRQVRRASDGSWALMVRDDVVGWRVADCSDVLDDLAVD